MDPIAVSPLDRAREDALLVLSRAILWGVAPLAAALMTILLLNGRTDGARTAALGTYLPMLLITSFALLLRPSPRRSLRRRGQIAILGLSCLSAFGLLMNGPRAANTAGLAAALSMAVLFARSWDGILAVVIGNSSVGLLGVLLREMGVIRAANRPALGAAAYDFVSGLIMVVGLGFSAYVLSVTLENYRRGQRELRQRTDDLLAAQSAGQHAQRQELVARLGTALAGEIAGQLEALGDAATLPPSPETSPEQRSQPARVQEARTRATQTLRLLESLGQRTTDPEPRADLHAVFANVDAALRPLLDPAQSLDLLDATTTGPLLAAGKLEQMLVHLALEAKDHSTGDASLVVRAYDGLGDVACGDRGRTWTIIEIGCVGGAPSTPLPSARSREDIRSLLVELVVANAGGRLEVERQPARGINFVLQLPSS